MKITIKKHISEETEETYEIKSFEEFYGKFYNDCNQEVYFGGFIKDDKTYWIKKQGNKFDIEVLDVCNGGHDDLELEIKRVLKGYKFLNEITKGEFFKQIKELINIKDV